MYILFVIPELNKDIFVEITYDYKTLFNILNWIHTDLGYFIDWQQQRVQPVRTFF